MNEYQLIKVSVEAGICILKINRPEALNALNSGVLTELNAFLGELENNKAIRALVITGEGKAFIAGADISQMSEMDPGQAEEFSRLGQESFSRLERLNIPVIAAVNGYALGGGCELAMACDIRIAGEYARFGQPEAGLGLIPGFAGTQRMTRLLGMGNALYYLMSGLQVKAVEALRIGLVQKLTDNDSLMDEAVALAGKIIRNGPNAVAKVKKVARQGMEMGIEKGMGLERKEFASLFGNEGTEGMKAFLEKRDPDWETTQD